MRTLLPAILALVCTLGAQTPTLVKDVNRQDRSSNPAAGDWHGNPDARFGQLGPLFLFRADGGAAGVELFSATTTPGSAKLIKDICPGRMGSHPHSFVTLGQRVLFGAYDTTAGMEPWITDGSAQGTRRIGDFFPGLEDGGFHSPLVLGSFCYFCVQTASGVYSLVKSDGTTAGTTVLGTFNQPWNTPTALGSLILFRGWGTGSAWVTDGTPAGTKVLNTGAGFDTPVVFRNKVYYWAHGFNFSLWVSDGTPAGTIELGVPAGITGRPWANPTVLGNRILFNGLHSPLPYRSGLWSTDGTLAGTVMLSNSIGFGIPCVVGNRCYFVHDGLYVTDGTRAGTSRITAAPLIQSRLTPLGNRLLFKATDANYSTGLELWISDGTAQGTVMLKDIHPGRYGSDPAHLTTYQGKALFRAENDQYGAELWVTDGTPQGTVLHTNILSAGKGYTRSSIFKYSGSFSIGLGPEVSGLSYFTTLDGRQFQMWRTDGTTRGTLAFPNVTVMDPRFLNSSFEPYSVAPLCLGNLLLFVPPASGPWTTDGNTAWPQTGGGPWYLYRGRVVGNRIGFLGKGSGTYDPYRLYFSDGLKTTAADNLGLSDFVLVTFALGDKLFLHATRKGVGRGLFVTDGTPGGTHLLLQRRDANYGQSVVFKRRLYFTATTATGRALYRTDGTPSGTGVVLPQLAAFVHPVVLGDKLLFDGYATDPKLWSMWASDGTTAGTQPFATNVLPGDTPVVCGDRVYFSGSVKNSGHYHNSTWYLCESDGTTAGTRVAFDPDPGVAYNPCYGLLATGSRHLFFQVLRCGRFNGGNQMIEGLFEGILFNTITRKHKVLFTQLGQAPTAGHLSHGRIMLPYDDGRSGLELHRIDIGTSAQPLGRGSCLTRFAATDPVLGGTLDITFADAEPGASVGLVLFGLPTHAPPLVGGNRLHFDLAKGLLGSLFLPLTGGRGKVTLPLANDPNFIGVQVVVQGVVGPTALPPLHLGFTGGVLLTFGR